ncbi:MAG: TonB-dependent receptor [Flavobacteriales bacterium]
MHRINRLCKWIPIGLGFLLFLNFTARAQSSSASIVGRVVEASGSGMAGAQVQLDNSAQSTATDDQGVFIFEGIEPGQKTLNITLAGHQPLSIQIQVVPGFMRLDDLLMVPGNGPELGPAVDPLLGSVLLEPAAVSAVTAGGRSPFAHQNFTSDELQKRDAAVDMPFLLRLTPSLVVTSDAGAGVGYTSMRIRGSDQTRINVTINGIPLNDAESHQVYWVDLPDLGSSVDGLQIQRGVGTSTNGPGAFGATVAVNTLTFEDEPGGRAVLGVGSFGTLRSSVSWSSGEVGETGIRMEGRMSRILSEGYVDRASSDLSSAQLGVVKSWETGKVSYTAMLGHERTYQSWFGVPEVALEGEPAAIEAWAANSYEYNYGADSDRIQDLIENGRQHNYYNYDDEVDDYRQDHHQLHWEQSMGAWRLGLTGHWTQGDGYYEQFKTDDDLGRYGIQDLVIGSDTLETGDIVRRRWLQNDFYGAAFSAEQRWEDAMLTVGGGVFSYVGDHFGQLVWAEHAGELTPGHRYYDGVGRKQDANVFFRGIKSLVDNRIRLQAEGQIRSVRYEASGLDNDLRTIDVSDDLLFFNPKLGLDWMPSADQRAFASIAVAHREPARTDYVDGPGTSDVQPEQLTDLELGWTQRWPSPTSAEGSFRMELIGYSMSYRNQLVLTGALNDVGSSLRTNVDQSYRRGLEWIADWEIKRGVHWSGNLTWSQNRIQNFTEVLYDYGLAISEVQIEHGETDIAFSPNVVATSVLSGSILQESAEGRSWIGTAEWAFRHVGEQFLDNTSNQNRMLPAYAVHDLRFRSAFHREKGQSWAINLFVNNVLDAMYSANGWTYSYRDGGSQTEVTENFLYPQAGRHWMVSLEWTF